MFPFQQVFYLLSCAVVIVFISGAAAAADSSPCKPRQYPGTESVVCVCNSTYCDTIPPVEPLGANEAVVFTSSKAGARLSRTVQKWMPTSKTSKKDPRNQAPIYDVIFNPGSKFQSVIGFGGAFTDAAGINIASLSTASQRNLLESYFTDSGLQYNIGRVPIASCDFSTREYSYDDTPNDFNLDNFKLADEDNNFKIPYIQVANIMTKGRMRLFASAWSAPGWMKTSGQMHGNGTLRGQPGDKYYTTWANYYIKFLEAYEAHNISFWGLTTQNEPSTGYLANYSFQTMGFTPELQRDWIKLNLGPALNNSRYKDIKLMILDDQRLLLPNWANVVLKDPEARHYVSGVALHWYWDLLTSSSVLDDTHNAWPAAFLFATEACAGWAAWEVRGPVLGSWTRFEQYAHDILDDMNHWVTGWTDWNLALDLKGGPNWVHNVVDSPIIINKTSDEFYKQPMFYALGHFSAFVPPDSIRVGIKAPTVSSLVESIGFITPAGTRVLVLLNRRDATLQLNVTELGKPKQSLLLNMDPHSMTTVLWKKQ